MKNAKGKLIVNVKLPTNFIDELKKEINDEIRVAQKKWNVSFATDADKLFARNLIVNNTLEQVRLKTLSIFGRVWDFSDIITVVVNAQSFNEITLPDENVKTSFVRRGQNWAVDNEKIDSLHSVPARMFDVEIQNLLKTWARTGAFYGVGSYT